MVNLTSVLDWWWGQDATVDDAHVAAHAAATCDRIRFAMWLTVAVAALLPIFLVPYAPLYDYYNWVYQGRIVADLLHHGPDAYSTVHQSYALNWRPIPNVGAPLGIGLLATVLSVDAAGRAFLALCVLLFASGFAYLVRSVQGRTTAMEVFGVPWAFGYFYYKGYESYLISLPLAFIAIGWLHRIYVRRTGEPSWGEVAALAALGAVTFLCHLLGWLVLAVALAVYGLLLLIRGHRRSVMRLAVSAAPTLAMLVSFAVNRAQSHRAGSDLYARLGIGTDKIISLAHGVTIFVRPDPFSPLSPLFLANAGALAALAVVALANLDRARMPARPVLLAAVALAGVVLVLPFANFGELNRPDERFVLPALLIGLAALPWKAFSPSRGAALALVILAIVALHAAEDAHASRLLVRVSDATAAAIPPDATVLSLTISEGSAHGGCAGGSLPTFGAATTRWIDLRRLGNLPPRRIDLLDTSLVRGLAIDMSSPTLAVQLSTLNGIRSQPDLAARYAGQYPYVEVFGCQSEVSAVAALLAGPYHQVAGGENYAVFARLATAQ